MMVFPTKVSSFGSRQVTDLDLLLGQLDFDSPQMKIGRPRAVAFTFGP